MATITLILGESGTGKTASLRNFKTGELAIVNVAGKPLPFRANFETLNNVTDFRDIISFMRGTRAKTIVIDDCQYIMSFQYMRRIREPGWEKFNDIQSDFFNLIEFAKSLPEDVTVYFLSHLETKEDGHQKIKTIGKMLDEKITIEGMFTTVLKTHVSDGKYYFLTQNSGMDTVKSPLGMFDTYAIDNDLKYVDEKIRNYYQIGEYLDDEAIAKKDAVAAVQGIENAGNGRVKRERKPRETAEKPSKIDETEKVEQTTTEAVKEPETATETVQPQSEEAPRQRRQRRPRPTTNIASEDDEIPF